MSSNELVWGCCEQKKKGDKFIKCINCVKTFHYECLSISCDVDSKNWNCPSCTLKSSKEGSTHSRSDQTSLQTQRPPKRQAIASPEQEGDTLMTRDEVQVMIHDVINKTSKSGAPVTQNEVKDIVQEVIKNEINGLFSKLTTRLSSDLQTIREEIAEVKQFTNFVSSQYEDFVKEFKSTLEAVKELREEKQSMNETINKLNNRISQLEQHARSNNVEIQCVPEKKDENLLNVISRIGETINCIVSEENVLHCTRIAKANRESTRPRSIVVQLSTPRFRDQFLAAAIKFNKSKQNPQDKLNASHLGLREATPIFVTEHLSPANKQLHAATRQRAKDKGYKYVWVRNGRIYARKDDNEAYIYVKDMDNLNKIV